MPRQTTASRRRAAAPLAPAPLPVGEGTRTSSRVAPDADILDARRRHAMIEEAAYFHAERRAFQPGHEAEDWYLAERDVDSMLERGADGMAGDANA